MSFLYSTNALCALVFPVVIVEASRGHLSYWKRMVTTNENIVY